MNIEIRAQALKTILLSADATDPAGVLVKYAAARVLTYDLIKRIESLPADEMPVMGNYMVGRLLAFIEHFEWAAIPEMSPQKSPQEWLEAARGDLYVVALKATES